MPVSAPADALIPTENGVPGDDPHDFAPKGYGLEATYWPRHEYPADPFPQKYDLNDMQKKLPRRGLPTMDCSTSPIGWRDSHGKNCQDYSDNWWCTPTGTEGPGWPDHW